MKKSLIILVAVIFAFIGTANAEKPDWVSEKKAVKDDVKAQKKEIKAYSDDQQEKKEKKSKKIKGEKKRAWRNREIKNQHRSKKN